MTNVINFFNKIIKSNKEIDFDFKGFVAIDLYSKTINSAISYNLNIEEESLHAFYNNGFSKCYCNYKGVRNYFNKLKLLKKGDLEYKIAAILQIAKDSESRILHQTYYTDSYKKAQITIQLNSIGLKDLIDYLSKY